MDSFEERLVSYFDIPDIRRISQHGEVWLLDVLCYDQFEYGFFELIEEYKTPGSICGYTATAILNELAQGFHNQPQNKYHTIFKDILIQLKTDQQYKLDTVEPIMQMIQISRAAYIDQNKNLFKDQEMETNYMRDWVATYEISDQIRIIQPMYDDVPIFFFRNVSWDYPEEIAKLQFEEKERVKEELPFKGMGHFIEQFHPKRQFLTKEQFKLQNTQCDTIKIVVIDMLGHFVTCLVIGFESRKAVFLLETTEAFYLNNPHFLQFVETLTN